MELAETLYVYASEFGGGEAWLRDKVLKPAMEDILGGVQTTSVAYEGGSESGVMTQKATTLAAAARQALKMYAEQVNPNDLDGGRNIVSRRCHPIQV